MGLKFNPPGQGSPIEITSDSAKPEVFEVEEFTPGTGYSGRPDSPDFEGFKDKFDAETFALQKSSRSTGYGHGYRVFVVVELKTDKPVAIYYKGLRFIP
jgi:hypothetical protein